MTGRPTVAPVGGFSPRRGGARQQRCRHPKMLQPQRPPRVEVAESQLGAAGKPSRQERLQSSHHKLLFHA